nr:zinc finger, CCHC-type, retrotransposon Gag domain protein [Tanacetum cinerariifolium]
MGCEDAFKTRLAVYKFEGNALAWWKAYKQAKGGDVWLITVTWAAKNFQWGLRMSTLNHLMCIPFTDVAQVSNAAHNYEILYERDDGGVERPYKRQKSEVPLRATPTRSALRVDEDTQDELLAPASSVVKLAI